MPNPIWSRVCINKIVNCLDRSSLLCVLHLSSCYTVPKLIYLFDNIVSALILISRLGTYDWKSEDSESWIKSEKNVLMCLLLPSTDVITIISSPVLIIYRILRLLSLNSLRLRFEYFWWIKKKYNPQLTLNTKSLSPKRNCNNAIRIGTKHSKWTRVRHWMVTQPWRRTTHSNLFLSFADKYIQRRRSAVYQNTGIIKNFAANTTHFL